MREHDKLGKDGCCLICKETKESCIEPCFACQCSDCFWYREMSGKCGYPIWKNGEADTGYKIVYDTRKAFLVKSNEFGKAWFPKSQVREDDEGFCWAPVWLLEEKGWMKERDWLNLNGLTIEEYEKRRLEGKSFEPSYEDIKHWR